DGTFVIRRRFFPLHNGVAAVVVHDASDPAAVAVAGIACGLRILAALWFLGVLHGLRLIAVGPYRHARTVPSECRACRDELHGLAANSRVAGRAGTEV